MATVTPVITDLTGQDQVIKITWALTTANPDGAPIKVSQFGEFADRTIYFVGTWGGATAAWEGGDGTVYMPITNPAGTAITKTANGINAIIELPEFSRPNLTTPGAGATITATLILRRVFRRGGK
ncbi:MAG TPA: hypothetical protein VFQ99_05135 [Gallionella sp.]|nr:hypothetical protein [Gallionella sp.]